MPKNVTKWGKPHKSSSSRSRPDRTKHVSKYSHGSNGKKTTTHHYKGSKEYGVGKSMNSGSGK